MGTVAAIVRHSIAEPLSEFSFRQALALLSAEVQEKVMAYVKAADRQLALAGKLAAHDAILKVAPGAEVFLSQLQFSEYHRPFLTGLPDFNISHSGMLALAAAVRTGRCGIDVEEIKPVDLKDFTRFFSAGEWEEILAAQDQLAQFYHWWTMKEAVMKADGRGMHLSPLEIKVNTAHSLAEVQGKAWHLRRVEAGEAYCACLATELECTEVVD